MEDEKAFISRKKINKAIHLDKLDSVCSSSHTLHFLFVCGLLPALKNSKPNAAHTLCWAVARRILFRWKLVLDKGVQENVN